VFSQAPIGEREAALGLGSTRWGMIKNVVLSFGKGGIIGVLALARRVIFE
jgi:phosphate transport system permease protein